MVSNVQTCHMTYHDGAECGTAFTSSELSFKGIAYCSCARKKPALLILQSILCKSICVDNVSATIWTLRSSSNALTDTEMHT